MSDTNSNERPDRACLLCPPPREVGRWRLAHDGYKTCDGCYDRLTSILRDISRRYLQLDPRPGASGEYGGRGAPGFGSRPPVALHVLAMTDLRSKSHPIAMDKVEYVFDPLADSTLEPGQFGPPAGAYVERREVWLGKDGRAHAEQENPVRSVPFTLAALAELVAEERGITPLATRDVHELCRWLDKQLDWLTRQELVVDVWDDLRALDRQMKPLTGEPGRRHVGKCPVVLDQGEHTRECGTKLYAPLRGDTIECQGCGETWPREQWLKLGTLLLDAS